MATTDFSLTSENPAGNAGDEGHAAPEPGLHHDGSCAHEITPSARSCRLFSRSRHMHRRKLSAVIAAATMALTLTACGDDKPDPIPTPTTTESPTTDVSPAPEAPDLDATQKKAYDSALAVYTDYQTFVTRISQDPDTTDRVDEVLALVTTAELKELNAEVQELIANDAYVEGAREVAWTVPVSVSDNKVVLEQCRTPGSWVLVGKDGQRAPQVGGSVNRVQMVDVEGDWRVAKTDGGNREC